MDETANPRGCKLEIGIKSSPESPDCFRKRIAECRHCKSLHDLSLHWHVAGNFAGTEGSLQASLAQNYPVLTVFLLFLINFLCQKFYFGDRVSKTKTQQQP